ncbi:hypothetical protein D043_0560A, partial [Vibrio parahaemolyticus EKP-021]
MFMPTYQSA